MAFPPALSGGNTDQGFGVTVCLLIGRQVGRHGTILMQFRYTEDKKFLLLCPKHMIDTTGSLSSFVLILSFDVSFCPLSSCRTGNRYFPSRLLFFTDHDVSPLASAASYSRALSFARCYSHRIPLEAKQWIRIVLRYRFRDGGSRWSHP